MQEKNEIEEAKKQIKNKQDSSERTEAAHEQAEKDIANDAELSAHNPNDDLDEAETARLGYDKNDLGDRI